MSCAVTCHSGSVGILNRILYIPNMFTHICTYVRTYIPRICGGSSKHVPDGAWKQLRGPPYLFTARCSQMWSSNQFVNTSHPTSLSMRELGPCMIRLEL